MRARFIACASLGVSALLAAACATRQVAIEGGGTPKAIRMVAVQLASDPAPTKYSAIIAPNAQVDLAFRVPGYVVQLHETKGADGRVRPLEPGDSITAGMVLARLRRPDYEAVADKARGARDEADAGIHVAEAQIAEAQAGLERAELDFERVSTLWEEESVTKPAYDGSKAARDIARAKLVAARSALTAARERAVSASGQLQEAEIALSDTELRAPFSGILLERHVDLGAFVVAGSSAFTLADLRLVKGLFNVPDSTLHNFRQGQALDLTVDAFPGDTFHGRVVSVAAAADARVRSFQIEVSVVNPGLKLRSGMIASVQVEETDGDRQVQIPVDALIHDPIRDLYLVYGAEQRSGRTYAKAIPVQPGPLSGSSVRIVRGLNPGQRIIVDGANLLRPGDLVREVD